MRVLVHARSLDPRDTRLAMAAIGLGHRGHEVLWRGTPPTAIRHTPTTSSARLRSEVRRTAARKHAAAPTANGTMSQPARSAPSITRSAMGLCERSTGILTASSEIASARPGLITASASLTSSLASSTRTSGRVR